MRSVDSSTWDGLVAIEPRLNQLLDEATHADSSTPHFCAVAAWYGYNDGIGFKGRMYRLVGFRAHDSRLQTMQAYEIATQKIYSALPPCRGCACNG
jgi:hypothetical protein